MVIAWLNVCPAKPINNIKAAIFFNDVFSSGAKLPILSSALMT